MVSGTVDGIKQTEIKKGNYKTWFRLHPNQSDPNTFGHVIVCPNLPNGAFVSDGNDKMSISEYYKGKGFREKPQELNPDADLEQDSKGAYFLVPKGYELKEIAEKTLFGDGKTKVDVIVPRVVKKQDTLDEVHVCGECGKECKTALALAGHKRSHEKKL